MRKKIMSLVLITAASCAASTAANANDWLESLSPYVGTEFQYRFLDYDPSHGRDLLKRNFPQGNIFAGLRFNDCIGLELGYQTTTREKRDVRLGPGSVVFGDDPVPEDDFLNWSTKTRIDGAHVNLLGYLALPECPNVEIAGLVGITYLNTKVSATLVSDAFETFNSKTDFKQSKVVARVGIITQYMLTDCIGARGSLIWENTGQFYRINPTNHFFATLRPNSFVKCKNSVIFGLGFFTNF